MQIYIVSLFSLPVHPRHLRWEYADEAGLQETWPESARFILQWYAISYKMYGYYDRDYSSIAGLCVPTASSSMSDSHDAAQGSL